MSAVQTQFDYSLVSAADRPLIEDATARIKALERRASDSLLEIGRHLIAVQEAIPGHFEDWLYAEFGWSRSAAYKFIQVVRNLGERVQNLDIAPSALYALASGNVPEEVREEFFEQAAAGKVVTNKQVQARLQTLKPQPAIETPTLEPIDAEPMPLNWTCLECGQEWPESRKYCDCSTVVVVANHPTAEVARIATPVTTNVPVVEIINDADVFAFPDVSPDEATENTTAFLTAIVEENVPYVLADLLGKPVLPINRALREFQNIPEQTLRMAAAKNPDFLAAANEARQAAQRLINLCASIQGQSVPSQIRRVV